MNQPKALLALLLSLSVTAGLAAQGSAVPAPVPSPTARAQAAAIALVTLYNQDTGLFNTTGWWNSANAITALADEDRVAHDRSHRGLFRSTFDHAPERAKVKAPGFLNEFYDDEGWWALAWIDVYDLTHDKRYLRTSQAIFADMSGGWDSTCGGGIWWKKDRHYKNAIANELFFSVAASLAQHARGKDRARYLDWANREWTWFSHSGMINADTLVNDGLDTACHNNGRTTWTYNQGVLLSGLAGLDRLAPQPDLLPTAGRIATAAITHLVDANGVLHDPCEPNCGEDGVQFKGIFARNLAHLQVAAPDPAFARFLTLNADSLWSNARTPENRFTTVWSTQAGPSNAGAQTSALDLLNAAAATTP